MPGDNCRNPFGEAGPLSSDVKIGDRIAKKDGDGVSGVRGNAGDAFIDRGVAGQTGLR